MIPPPRWVIPPFPTRGDILRRAAPSYRPRDKLNLLQWSIRHRGYDPDTLPWQNELRLALSDPVTSEIGIIKPAQCGATTIGVDWLGWIVESDPSDTLVCQPDRLMAEKFVKGRLDPMIAGTSAVQTKLRPADNANNQWIKLFHGMMLTTVWPVASQFTQLSIRFGWLDDYDQYDDNIGETGGEGGQGSGIALLDGRFISHEGREKKYISSSPAKDEKSGIEAFVADGTDERIWPECPHCGERWEIDFLRDLRFDTGGTADQAEATAHVVCPTNGCILEPSDRRKLHESCGRLPNYGFVQANHGVSKRRRTFRVDGLMALPSWPTLARKWRDAQIAWEVRQDESALRTVINTQGGKNYRSKHSGEKPVETDTLKLRREQGLHLGVMPRGAKVWVILTDTQANRLEHMALAFGDGLESWIVDRWSTDVLEDGITSLAPFSHPEHARVMLSLWDRRYPLADGSGMSPPPLTVQLDVGGGGVKGEGAAEFAKALWEMARAAGVQKNRITLTKGGNSMTGELMPRAKFAEQKRRGGAKRTSAELWLPNVHRIKGVIDARLRRAEPGPGYIHLPGGKTGGGPLKAGQDEGATGRLLDHHVEEITAEELKKGKWEKVRPRNETWDLLVYGYASLLRPPFAQARTHMRWVPRDYRVPDQAELPLPIDPMLNHGFVGKDEPLPAVAKASPVPTKPKAPQVPTSKRNPVNRFTKRSGNWIGKR
jgi:phage terminase large subunit GpA-like protein